MTANSRDIDILARTLVGEARGEGQAGMECVASVVMNRCAFAEQYIHRRGYPHALFGDGTPADACLRPWQFSCWNKADPNRAIINGLDESVPIFRQALNIAREAINGTLEDRTNGATHYHDRRMKKPPFWADGHVPCHTEGHHVFFKNV